MRGMGRFTVAVGFALLGFASAGRAQQDECLVEIHDQNGFVAPDNASLCQVATNKTCTFSLQLCVNQPEAGCTAAALTGKRVRARGHCIVGKLQVAPSGTEAKCGDLVPVKLRTRQGGRLKGQCSVRVGVGVRSAKAQARSDVDKLKLTCMPASGQCPTTTTTSTTTSSTTTTRP